MQLLHHAQRRQPRAAAGGERLEPPALLLTDIGGGHVEVEGDTGAVELHEHRVLHGVLRARALEVRHHPLRLREVREPQGEVQQREPVVEERPASRLRATQPPPLLRALVVIRAGADAGELAQLAAAQEAGERLHVAAESIVVGDEHLRALSRGGVDDPLHAARRQRQRPLAQHVQPGGDRAQHVRLVQVVRCCDHHRRLLVGFEQVLDIRVDIGNVEPVGEGARLGAVVVAEGGEGNPAHLVQHRQVRELRDGSRTHDPDAHRFCHRSLSAEVPRAPTVVPG